MMSPEKHREHSRKQYQKVKNDPDYKERKKNYYIANKQKFVDQTVERRREQKLRAINYLGGQCQKCKGVFPPFVYDFHHKDPTEKEGHIHIMLKNTWDKLVIELDKCILLCANCHREVHHGV